MDPTGVEVRSDLGDFSLEFIQGELESDTIGPTFVVVDLHVTT